MKVWKLLVAAGVLALVLGGMKRALHDTRSVGPVAEAQAAESSEFDPLQSAQLSVGIEKFDDPSVEKVQFAVDDAVDLSYASAIELQLVQPSRVVLALSGAPHKQESKDRLQKLKDAGAQQVNTSQESILQAVQQQARAAGKHGLLIVTLATHGFSEEGTQYLLTSSSMFRHADTSISASNLLDVAAGTGAERSLILIDACRERLKTATRSGEADPESKALFLQGMNKTKGQAVLWAAAAGGYAYDDAKLKNGVFTHYVLEGLHCAAKTDERGFVTFDTLADYVETNVRQWIITNRHADPGSATQYSVDGSAKEMPLVSCTRPVGASQPTPPNPASVEHQGNTFILFSPEGFPLGAGNVRGPIAKAEVADLDDDGVNEVIVGVGQDGEDAGRVIVFDGNRKELWRADTNAGLPSARLGIATFVVDQLRRGIKRRQIAVLSSDGEGSRLMILESDGKPRPPYPFAGDMRFLNVLKTANSWATLVVAGSAGKNASVSLFSPNKPLLRKLWSGATSQLINKLDIRDCNNDLRRDLIFGTANGSVCVDAGGKTIFADAGVTFALLGRRATIRR